MSERYVDLAGDTDSQVIRIHRLDKRTGQWLAMDITIFGNGDMHFAFPDDVEHRIVTTQTSAYNAWLNGHAVR